MKLSVIICIYNTPREYLRQSLESIVNSTLEKYSGEYEICLVDDGSSIDYSDLVEKFGVRYQKTENRGILKARLSGIEMSNGEYIAFCDSDDTVSAFYYSPMLDEAYKSGADIIINDWAYHAANKKFFCKNDITIKHDIENFGKYPLKLFFMGEGKHHSLYVLWNKIYRASLLKRAAKIIQAYGYESSYGEDALVNFLAWREAKNVKNIHRGYYFYRIHEAQTVNAGSVGKLKGQIKNMAQTFDFMENELENHPDRTDLLSHLNAWRDLCARYHYTLAMENGYTVLYDYILEKYKQKAPEISRKEDSREYFHKIYLGDNFDEIDKALYSLWTSSAKTGVRYQKGFAYENGAVKYLAEHGKISAREKGKSKFHVPKRKVSLKNRLYFNPVIYKLSLALFKKNSKIRAVFKNKI